MSKSDLEALRKSLAKDIGVELLWGDNTDLEVKKLPLGVAPFDRILGGGLAFGRTTLLIGEWSSGKTLLSYLAIRAAQSRGLPCAYVDAERSWDPEWATTLGIDPSNLILAQPRTGEKAFDLITALVATEPHGVVVLDSLASLTADVETENDMESNPVALQARLINRGLRRVNSENQGWIFIIINQLRSTIGGYGNPEVLPGGKGQQFYAWQMIRVARGEWLTEGGGPHRTNRVGYKLRITLEKSKQTAPFQEAEVDFYYTGEIDELSTLIDLGLELGYVERAGAWFKFHGNQYQGRKGLSDAIRDNDELRAALTKPLDSIDEE